MPAKKTISKDKIAKAALKIVQKYGMDGLNMRALAKECNCSTQPIYLCFGGAENLKEEVGKRIFSVYLAYREAEIARGEYPEYKAAGMAYIRFAKEQKEFFKYLFMRNRAGEKDNNSNTTADFSEMKKVVSANYGLKADKAASLHTHMWIWVHGIASMYATGFLDWDFDTVSELLTEEFAAVSGRLK